MKMKIIFLFLLLAMFILNGCSGSSEQITPNVDVNIDFNTGDTNDDTNEEVEISSNTDKEVISDDSTADNTDVVVKEEIVVETIEVVEPSVKEFDMTAQQWAFIPETITVQKGDTVKLHIKSIDVTHGFRLSAFGINDRLEPGKTIDVSFVADKSGTFPFVCNVVCGSGHSRMRGELIVTE